MSYLRNLAHHPSCFCYEPLQLRNLFGKAPRLSEILHLQIVDSLQVKTRKNLFQLKENIFKEELGTKPTLIIGSLVIKVCLVLPGSAKHTEVLRYPFGLTNDWLKGAWDVSTTSPKLMIQFRLTNLSPQSLSSKSMCLTEDHSYASSRSATVSLAPRYYIDSGMLTPSVEIEWIENVSYYRQCGRFCADS